MSAVVYDVILVPSIHSPVESITSISYVPSDGPGDIGIVERPLLNWVSTKERLKETTGQRGSKNAEK